MSPLSKVSTKYLYVVEFIIFLYLVNFLEDCGVDFVGRGIALGFERLAKGSDARIIYLGIIDVRI